MGIMKAHFYDIDCLVDLNQKAWVVDKLHPSIPILKISESDFNLFLSGIYRSQGNKIDFNGKEFWLPDDFLNKIKIKIKKTDINLGNLAISMQEFLNGDIIKNLSPTINLDIIKNLKNKKEDIYIICSKQTKRAYSPIIEKLKGKLAEEGISIKGIYFISETFYSQKRDQVKWDKLILFAEHLTGYKVESKKFIDKEVSSYNEINYYDNATDTQKYSNYINDIIQHLVKNTETGIKEVIIENLSEETKIFNSNRIFDNTLNQIETTKRYIILKKFNKINDIDFISEEYLFGMFGRKKKEKIKINPKFTQRDKELILDLFIEVADRHRFMEIQNTKSENIIDYISGRKRANKSVVFFIQEHDIDTLISFVIVYEDKFVSEQLKLDLKDFERRLSGFGIKIQDKDEEYHRFNPIQSLEYIHYYLVKK
jgi:hypothetical protein